MKKFYRCLMTLAICFCGLNVASAQEAVVSAGGVATDGDATVSYTVGQVAYYSDASIVEGVQVPYEIVVTAIDDVMPELKLSVFPNPTANVLTLELDEATLNADGTVTYEVYNMRGSVIKVAKVVSQQSTIDLSAQAPATYFVRVATDEQVIKVFKVIKK